MKSKSDAYNNSVQNNMSSVYNQSCKNKIYFNELSLHLE